MVEVARAWLLDRLREDWHWAQRASMCRRNAKAAAIWSLHGDDAVVRGVRAVNGPMPGVSCTGLKGGCGCAHAELRAINELTKIVGDVRQWGCEYLIAATAEPCVACANAIALHPFADRFNVAYLIPYHSPGKKVLRAAGIRCERAAEW